MNVKADVEVAEILNRGQKKFSKLKLPGANFRGKDLRSADFRGASVPGADFTDADLTYANFEGANCTGANFTNAKCHRTNFKDACLSQSIMHPADLYGATVTLECKSFQGMDVAPGYWYGWLFYCLLMKPPSKDVAEQLMVLMGAERYMVLRQQYVRRQV